MSDANDQPAMQNPEKDPQEWTTGDEPMTGPQRSYLQEDLRLTAEVEDLSQIRRARIERSGDISFIKN